MKGGIKGSPACYYTELISNRSGTMETDRADLIQHDLCSPATVNFAARKEGAPMTTTKRSRILTIFTILLALVAGTLVARQVRAQKQQDPKPSSFTPVMEEPFDVVRARDKAAKTAVKANHRLEPFK